MAENLFPEQGSGAKKRKWVVDFINDNVNLPLLNERQEERVIGFAVDIVCELVFDAVKKAK
jgi:hypothetical protein|tara:strand:- start:205 stop:387 length:183 start_codon:yes stop_codon:yes gene_type:complete